MYAYAPDAAFTAFPGGGTPNGYVYDQFGFPLVGPGRSAQAAKYEGVVLDTGKPAVASVYLGVTDRARIVNRDQPLEITLTPLLNGAPLRGAAPIRVRTTDPPFVSPAFGFVTSAERDDPRYSVQIPLDQFWLERAASGTFGLRATVSIPKTFDRIGSVRECLQDCSADNTFQLDGVRAQTVPGFTLQQVFLTGADRIIADPKDALAEAFRLYPGGQNVVIAPSIPVIDVSWEQSLKADDFFCLAFGRDDAGTRKCRSVMIDAALNQWAVGHKLPGVDAIAAIHHYPMYVDKTKGLEPGWTSGSLLDNGFAPDGIVGALGLPHMMINDGSANRPYTAAAHEFGHLLGLPHADMTCGGNANGQIAEAWAPDNTGRLQGTAFDTRKRPADPKADGESDKWYDLMSYCAKESRAWLSARNWNRSAANLLQRAGMRRLAVTRTSVARQALATAVIGPAGGRILGVAAASGTVSADRPGAAYRLRARDAAGRVLSDVGVGPEHGVGTVTGAVAPGAAVVELVEGETVLDRLERSAPPRVRLLAVRVGSRAAIRWRTSDADQSDRRPPSARIDFSPDGGRRWATVYEGPDDGRQTLPGRLLAGSDNARLRVTVSDAFNEATATSRRLRTAGTPPTVTIVSPQPGAALRDDGRTLLVGRAVDDRGRVLEALTWFAGSRRLGRGPRLLTTLPGGRYRLRLVARGNAASLPVRIVRPPLRLDTLHYAASVPVKAKRLRVRVGASEAATLTVGGKRYRVGTRARTLVITLPKGPVRLKAVLRTRDGRTLRGTIVVTRLN